jgi:hypothetical protein
MRRPPTLLIALIFAAAIGATAAFTQSFPLPVLKPGPTQPIPFNHKIHAGDNKMDCLYCHFGADKSPIANVPPVEMCMGCHKVTATDKPTIQRLTQHFEKGEPVPWVQVHVLPQHVKFNHKRHVKAGITCQECHGKVEEMVVVRQVNSLKMGWCVTCHRSKLDDPKTPASMDCLICHH